MERDKNELQKLQEKLENLRNRRSFIENQYKMDSKQKLIALKNSVNNAVEFTFGKTNRNSGNKSKKISPLDFSKLSENEKTKNEEPNIFNCNNKYDYMTMRQKYTSCLFETIKDKNFSAKKESETPNFKLRDKSRNKAKSSTPRDFITEDPYRNYINTLNNLPLIKRHAKLSSKSFINNQMNKSNSIVSCLTLKNELQRDLPFNSKTLKKKTMTRKVLHTKNNKIPNKEKINIIYKGYKDKYILLKNTSCDLCKDNNGIKNNETNSMMLKSLSDLDLKTSNKKKKLKFYFDVYANNENTPTEMEIAIVFDKVPNYCNIGQILTLLMKKHSKFFREKNIKDLKNFIIPKIDAKGCYTLIDKIKPTKKHYSIYINMFISNI